MRGKGEDTIIGIIIRELFEGITCVQCTPVQLEILRRAGAMPVSSRRCGMITRREAERLCKSFLGDNAPPRLPDDFAFSVHHECAWGCRVRFCRRVTTRRVPSASNAPCAVCFFHQTNSFFTRIASVQMISTYNRTRPILIRGDVT